MNVECIPRYTDLHFLSRVCHLAAFYRNAVDGKESSGPLQHPFDKKVSDRTREVSERGLIVGNHRDNVASLFPASVGGPIMSGDQWQSNN